MNLQKILYLLLAMVLCSYLQAQSLLGGNPSIPQIHARVLTWADYDTDGDPDLLMSGKDTTGVIATKLLRNDGATTFTTVTVPFHAWPMAAAAWGDLDGDGDPDLLQTGTATDLAPVQNGKGAIALWRNNGVSGFAPVTTTLPGLRAGFVNWADLDGDGDQDCLLGGEDYYAGLVTLVARNDAGALQATSSSVLTGLCCGEVALGNLGGDSLPDLILTGQSPPGQWHTTTYLNQGSLQFTAYPGILPLLLDASIAVSDMDGDGDDDILGMGMALPYKLGAWRQDLGSGWTALGLAGQAGVTRGMARWADFDGDGLQDVIYAGLRADGSTVTFALRQHTPNNFMDVQPGNPLPGLHEPAVAIADWDGDGHPDFVLSGIWPNGHPYAQLFKWNTSLNRFEP